MANITQNCPNTIELAWRWAASLLTESDSAQLDAQLLLLHVLKQHNRVYLLTWPDKSLTTEQIQHFCQLVDTRLHGHPIAHIIGEREFWGLPLKVNPSTLIPRPDTETLVEVVINQVDQQSTWSKQPVKLVDLGTGTGAIALALKSEFPHWQVSAVEYNPQAAELARQNALKLALPIEIYQGSWFEPFANTDRCFDIIVSNPPYIEQNDPHIDTGDVRFEPISALVAQDQGLADIRHIAITALQYLNTGGLLAFEHGYTQAAAVTALLSELGYKNIQTVKDIAQQDRITFAYKQ
ncbi:hemK protein [Catenovulum agarivorans DS-2]|uniref:Release factor glutamine methyltransferase n=1 Tax=Catenovulum agarivorans DS-2 TaxID=1328313 RepID=W7QK04_9ALTE|nr:peptide chain release factor N(5)-glutamine methyltransferase [Catenovulum agarivorans]EWH12231.1 hemK protein [Catenovulum agarivorans DS-2]